jgi:hypothetical protein
VTFNGSPKDITINDKKWRFCSSNWAELGYSRKKCLHLFGCVLNIACDCPIGLFVSCSMSQFGDTATNRVKVIIQRSLSVETTEEVHMEGKIIHATMINSSVFVTKN